MSIECLLPLAKYDCQECLDIISRRLLILLNHYTMLSISLLTASNRPDNFRLVTMLSLCVGTSKNFLNSIRLILEKKVSAVQELRPSLYQNNPTTAIKGYFEIP